MRKRKSVETSSRSGLWLVLSASSILVICCGTLIAAASGSRTGGAPPDFEAQLRLAQVRFKEHRFSDATGILKRLEEARADDHRVHSLLGQVYVRLSNSSPAIFHFMKAVGIQPDDVESNKGLGTIYGAMGLADLALPYLEKATQLDPECAKSWAALGKVYRSKHMAVEAVRALERAAELDPSDIAVTRQLHDLLAGRKPHDDVPHLARPTVPSFVPTETHDGIERVRSRP